jgi:beta-phosphoglucomutase family hydrolase
MTPETSLTAAVGDAEAILFDLDGVLFDTAVVHRRAWADLFNAYFSTVGGIAPYTEDDYAVHLDGRPRYDGVQAVLASRGLTLPWGDPADSPDRATVCGLGNRKNEVIQAALAGGVEPYPETIPVLLSLLRRGQRLAVVSSSCNAQSVLAGAGLRPAFEIVVDGDTALEHRLKGKPAPDAFLYAAHSLGVEPTAAVVVEDALAGVAAGRAGGFGLVVGVDRGMGADLISAGADVVVHSLAELAGGVGGVAGSVVVFAPYSVQESAVRARVGEDC